MKLAKTLTGIGVVLIGAGIHFIPAIGQIASPYIMSAGVGMINIGVIDKVIRKRKGGDIFETEKKIINVLKNK